MSTCLKLIFTAVVCASHDFLLRYCNTILHFNFSQQKYQIIMTAFLNCQYMYACLLFKRRQVQHKISQSRSEIRLQVSNYIFITGHH